ncbi:hypothetical protein ACFQYP_62525 [Nonomuraea antimicrobica]
MPAALKRRPSLVAAHDIEIRAAAPGLRAAVPARRRSLADDLPRGQRVLVPGVRRSLRIANGLAEFVRDHLAGSGPLTLVVANLGGADHTDAELVRVLRRRLDPGLLSVEEGPSAPARARCRPTSTASATRASTTPWPSRGWRRCAGRRTRTTRSAGSTSCCGWPRRWRPSSARTRPASCTTGSGARAPTRSTAPRPRTPRP